MSGDILSKIKLKDKIFDFTINYGADGRNFREIDNVIPVAPENIELLQGSNILQWTTDNLKNTNNLTSYRLNIETESKSIQLKHLKNSNYDISKLIQDLQPYSELKIEIFSETPWATSKTKLYKTIHLPMGKPSEPRNLQVFWEQPTFQPFYSEKDEKKFNIRWDRPTMPNGPVNKYILNGNCVDLTKNCLKQSVDGNQTGFLFQTRSLFTQMSIWAVNAPPKMIGKPNTLAIKMRQKDFNPVPNLLFLDSNNRIGILELVSPNSITSLGEKIIFLCIFFEVFFNL